MSEFFRFIGLTLIGSYGADANAKNCGGRTPLGSVQQSCLSSNFSVGTLRKNYLIISIWISILEFLTFK